MVSKSRKFTCMWFGRRTRRTGTGMSSGASWVCRSSDPFGWPGSIEDSGGGNLWIFRDGDPVTAFAQQRNARVECIDPLTNPFAVRTFGFGVVTHIKLHTTCAPPSSPTLPLRLGRRLS